MTARVKQRSIDTFAKRKTTDRLLDDPELFLNRELAWLAFNDRVLKEAEKRDTPLLERLKFLSIFSSNLDEFFMVRLSSLFKLLENQESGLPVANQTPGETDAEETLDEVSLFIRRQFRRAYATFQAGLLPSLAGEGVTISRVEELSRQELDRLDEFFENQIFPILTPLAVDQAHPFPYLSNLSLYLAVSFKEMGDNGEPLLAFVEIPPKLARFVAIPTRVREHRFVVIEDLIKRHLEKLFPWSEVEDAYVFRVTRNLDYQLLEGEVKDLMKSIELELKDRAQRFVVRMEVEQNMPEKLRSRLRLQLELEIGDVYECSNFLNLRDLLFLTKLELKPSLRDSAFSPKINARLSQDRDIFDVIRERDVLLHHPYESFSSVLEFLGRAAEDPNVLAIKQTLYRIGGDSPVIEALVRAAEKGKQVTAVVELKARFDEHNNIAWARRLERAGAHVVFGFVGLKTHAKCALVIRREGQHLQRYAHISTGNYNSNTARLYTDLCLLTASETLTSDLAKLFNLLTGFNLLASESKLSKLNGGPDFETIKVAPFGLRDFFLRLIEDEIKSHQVNGHGHIILKMNSLTDLKLIQGLYGASQAGVRIDLIVRGVCILRPGLKGISENIRVISIIDRFLEHSRIFWFRNNNRPRIFLGSADFMPRNMDKRVEVVWPVEEEHLKAKVMEILSYSLKDNTKAHVMRSDGTYVQASPVRNKNFRSQDKMIEFARTESQATLRLRESMRQIELSTQKGESADIFPMRMSK
ncbi:polyphosphate kinase 1 [bacterium]|nr:polyphosphate kinase 1 [bacterium]